MIEEIKIGADLVIGAESFLKFYAEIDLKMTLLNYLQNVPPESCLLNLPLRSVQASDFLLKLKDVLKEES